jgi:hypothetical protein
LVLSASRTSRQRASRDGVAPPALAPTSSPDFGGDAVNHAAGAAIGSYRRQVVESVTRARLLEPLPGLASELGVVSRYGREDATALREKPSSPRHLTRCAEKVRYHDHPLARPQADARHARSPARPTDPHGLSGKAAVDFAISVYAHNGREVATEGLFADELIEQPSQTREVRRGARRQDSGGHEMGKRMKAPEVDPREFRHCRRRAANPIACQPAERRRRRPDRHAP